MTPYGLKTRIFFMKLLEVLKAFKDLLGIVVLKPLQP